jgi:Fe-S-cluster containining protein
MSKRALPVLSNAPEATFDCIFGRGCEGICCKNGRPSVGPDEKRAIQGVLVKVMPHLRPEARKLIEAGGFLSNRTKLGYPMVRVVKGWCVFFNHGCTLHKLGMDHGDTYRYKPVQCALFPLERGNDGDWYVRQWGFRGEKWELFCLNPNESEKPATDTLQGELALAAEFDRKVDLSRRARPGKKRPAPVRLKRTK